MVVNNNETSLNIITQPISSLLIIFCYVLFALSGLIGSTLMIWFLLRNKEKMKKIGDIFKVNLIIADLFICLVCGPFKVCIFCLT